MEEDDDDQQVSIEFLATDTCETLDVTELLQ